MSRGGRQERFARHLCACSRHWPRDEDEERRRWDELEFSDRDYWRFIADRARKYIKTDSPPDAGPIEGGPLHPGRAAP